MSAESLEEEKGRLIGLPVFRGLSYTSADYVMVAAVLAKKQRYQFPDLNSSKGLADLGIEAQQEALESRKRLEENTGVVLPEWEITSDINVIQAIAGHLYGEFDKLGNR